MFVYCFTHTHIHRHSYPMFLNLLSTFIYIPICFAYILPMAWYGKLEKGQMTIPKYKVSCLYTPYLSLHSFLL